MVFARSHDEVNNLRAGIARIGKLSDSIAGVGPFKIGLDGILAWVPVVGTVYSSAAGIVMLWLGLRARVPLSILMEATTILGLRTAAAAVGEVVLPVIVPTEVLVDFFRAHKWAADMMLKSIDNTVYVEGPRHPSNPDYVAIREQIRSGAERRRVVFLG
jgi:hypothetical protein